MYQSGYRVRARCMQLAWVDTVLEIRAMAQEATELQAEAAALLSPEMRALAEEMGLLGLSVAAVDPPAKTAADRLAEMTAQILETQAATDLEAEALALLSPELRALAEELGLFGLRVGEGRRDYGRGIR